MSKQLPIEDFMKLFKKVKAMTSKEQEKWAKDNNIPDDDDFAGFDSKNVKR